MVLSESRKSITKGRQTFIGALVSSGAGWRIPYIWRKKPCGIWIKSPAFLFTAKFTTSILLGMKSCTASTRFRKRSTIRSVPGNSSRSTNAWRFVIYIQKWTITYGWTISSRVKLRDRPHSLIEPRRKVCQRRPTSILPQVQRHNMLEKKKSLLLVTEARLFWFVIW